MRGKLDHTPHPKDKDATIFMLTVRTQENSIGFGAVMLAASVMEDALNLIAEKSKGYGDAWRDQGWMGNLARIQSKTSRLRNMLWQDHETGVKEESVEDTLLDLLNLSAFMMVNRWNANKWGRRP